MAERVMHAHVVRVRQEHGNMVRAMPHGNALTRYPGPVYRTGPPFLMLSLAPLQCSPLPPSRAMLRPGIRACRLGPETKRAAMYVAEGLGAQNGPGHTAGCQAFAAPASTIINIISSEAACEHAIISRERRKASHKTRETVLVVAVITRVRWESRTEEGQRTKEDILS